MLKTKTIIPTIAILTLTILVSGVIVVKQEISHKKTEAINQEQQVTKNSNNNQERIGDNDENVEVITSDIDTSNWKTYRNEEYGFEFKYPEEWYTNERERQFSPYPLSANNDFGIFVLNVSNSIGKNYSSYDDAIDKVFEFDSMMRVSRHLIDLNGDKFVQFRTLANNQRGTFFLTDNKYFIDIFFIPAGEISLDIYNAILLTYKSLY